MNADDTSDSLSEGEDREALWEVLQQNRPRLLERIRLMMGDEARRRAGSHDFLQDVFVKAMRSIERAPTADDRGFLRWVTAIARNGIRDSVRGRRERAFDSLSTVLADRELLETATPSKHADDLEGRLRLLEAIEALPEEQRRAIELRSLEGLSNSVAGERMERSADAFRKLHHRAMVRLGQRLNARPERMR